MNKDIRITVRVTPDLKKILDEYVSLIPGEQSDVMREALEQHLARNLPIMRAMNEHNGRANATANAQPP